MANRKFAGKNVLVTGAASGIGKATAQAFAEAGAHVVLADLNRAALELVAAAMPGTVRIETCDVGDPNAVAAMAARIHDEIGPLDILVNNAGVGFAGSFMEQDAVVWARILRVNLMGVVNGIHSFLPAMRAASGSRHIVNVSSGSAMTPIPNGAAYSASKAAVRALGEALAIELHGSNITLHTVFPGIINTPIADPKTSGASMSRSQLDRIRDFYNKKGCAPEVVARDILAGISAGRAHILSGPLARSGDWLSRLSPRLARKFTRQSALEIGFLAE